jgi:hypothetical protein
MSGGKIILGPERRRRAPQSAQMYEEKRFSFMRVPVSCHHCAQQLHARTHHDRKWEGSRHAVVERKVMSGPCFHILRPVPGCKAFRMTGNLSGDLPRWDSQVGRQKEAFGKKTPSQNGHHGRQRHDCRLKPYS